MAEKKKINTAMLGYWFLETGCVSEAKQAFSSMLRHVIRTFGFT